MKAQPLRRCVGCGQMKDKPILIRIARSREGVVSIDQTGKEQGRAAYVCKDAACKSKAQKSKGLERSLKCQIPPEIYEALAEQMVLQ